MNTIVKITKILLGTLTILSILLALISLLWFVWSNNINSIYGKLVPTFFTATLVFGVLFAVLSALTYKEE